MSKRRPAAVEKLPNRELLYPPMPNHGGWFQLQHSATCPLSKVTEECARQKITDGQTNAKVCALMRDIVPDAANLKHVGRVFCPCMTDFEFDKHYVLELMSRDLLMDAFESLVSAGRNYGFDVVLKDLELRRVALNYLNVRQLYLLMSQESAISEKAKKKNIKPPTKFSVHPALDLLEQPITPVIYRSDKLQMFGEHFKQLIAGRENPPLPNEPVPKMLDLPWKPAAAEDDFYVWYRIYGNGRIDFRLEGLVEASMFDILSLCSEVEMTSHWIPYFKFPFKFGLSEAKCLGRFARFNKVSRYRVDLPFPMKNVELVVHGWSIDDLERNNRLTVCMKSFDESTSPEEKETWPLKPPEQEKKYQRINFGGGACFEPRGNKSIYLNTIWCLNIKDSVNETFVQFVAGTFMKAAFHKFQSVVQKNAHNFEKARKADTWLYGYIEDRIKKLEQAGHTVLAKNLAHERKTKPDLAFVSNRLESQYINKNHG